MICGNPFKSMQICIKLYIPAGTEGGLATANLWHKQNVYNTSSHRKDSNNVNSNSRRKIQISWLTAENAVNHKLE